MRVKIKCLNCNKEFYAFKSANRRFCSKSCTATTNNKTRKLQKHRIEVKCSFCNKKFIIQKSTFEKHNNRNLKNFYCNKSCMGKDKKGDIRKNTSLSLIKAYKEGRLKPNRYKGINGGYRKDLKQYFRSNWEANYARLLNYLNIKWLYEPKVFTLNINNKETTYRPDFYLFDYNEYHEIKGFWKNSFEKQKFIEFSKNNNCKLIEHKEYSELTRKYKHKILNWEIANGHKC